MSQEKLELELVLQRDTVGSPFGERRLYLPGAACALAVEGAKVHLPLLVEAEGPRVVVGGNEPGATVSCGYGVVADRLHKDPADPPSLLHADNGDHLALAVGRLVGQESDVSVLPRRRRSRGGPRRR